MRTLITILLLGPLSVMGADRKLSDMTTTATIASGTDKLLLHKSGPTNMLATLADVMRMLTNNTLATSNLLVYGSGTAATTLHDSDASHHFRVAAHATTTTNINLVAPAAPYSGYLKYTLSDATNLAPTEPFIQDVGDGKILREFVYEFALGDETNAIVTGTSLITWRAPWAFTVTAVRSSLSTASSSGLPTVDINEGGTTIISTKLTIDANEKTSTTAATAAVISDTAIADDAEITFDIDVAGTGAKGLKVKIYGYR